MSKNGLDGFLKVPMSNESIRVPDDLNQSLLNVLHSHRGVGKSSPDPIKLFMQLLARYDSLLSKNIDSKQITD